MLLSPEALQRKLASDLKASRIDPLWVIADNEPLLAQEAADAIRGAARTLGYAERTVLALAGNSDWNQLSEAVGEISLFSPLRIIEVRLATPSPGIKGTAALAALASQPLEGVCVIVSVPQADWRVTKAKWFSGLAAAGNQVSCEPVPRSSLPAWIQKRLSAEGLSIEPEALRLFADQTEGNLLAAAQEIRKIALLHEADGPVTLVEVESSVLNNSRFDIGSVSLAAMLGDAGRACRAIEGIRAEFDTSQAMPILLFAFSEDIRKMIALRSRIDAGQNPQAAVRELRIFPREKAAAVTQGAKRLSAAKLKNALSVCADIDRLYKGLSVKDRDSDPWTELKSVASFIAR